ncbi:MAG: hypothetical protein OEX00_12720, partial [Gammaproteobacteria bacterium]|nr:hypothetical protein [Gammaproteobacteria bacterium]
MKLDIKSISTLVVIMAALAAGAYSLGLSSAKNTSSSMSSQSVGNSSAPAHPSSTRSTTTE